MFISRGRIRLFSAARCRNRARCWAGCWRAKHPADADIVVPVPDSGVAAAIGYAAESGLPFRQALIRNHYVGRTFIEPSQAIRDFGVKLKLNPVRSLLEGKRVVLVDDSIVRGTTQPQDRAHGAPGGRARSSRAHLLPAHHFALLLRRRYAEQERTDRREQHGRRDPRASSKPIRWLSFAASLREAVADDRTHEYCYACYTGDYPTELINIEELMAAKKR